MTLLPFSKLLSGSNHINSKIKNATGLIKDVELLLNSNAIESLQKKHKGIFCYLALDTQIDSELYEYIKTGSLASESGDNLIILYSINTNINSIKVIENDKLQDFFDFDYKSNINIEIIQALYGDNLIPSLPGLLVFDNLPNSIKSIYIPFMDSKFGNNLNCLREVIRILRKSCQNDYNPNKSIIEEVSIQVAISNINYHKNSKYNFKEHIINIYRNLIKIKGDLISLIA